MQERARFPGFLDHPDIYATSCRYWQELLKEAGPDWQTPWLKTCFMNGEPFMDGNPIASAIHRRTRRGIRIIQEPLAGSSTISAWFDRFDADGPEEVLELVIVLSATERTLKEAAKLVQEWLGGKDRDRLEDLMKALR